MVGALALPAATAHILAAYAVYNMGNVPPTFVGCWTFSIGEPNREPHAAYWTLDCAPISHGFLV